MKSGFLEILNALHDRHVEFVIVGGVAAALHGGSRVTFDLDLVPRESDAFRTQARGMLALSTTDGDTRCIGFDELRRRAVEVTVGQRIFLVASIDDLIAMKERAGRPQDLLDIAELRNIQKRLG